MSKKQKEAAKDNIKKAQEAWQNMSSEERAERQPEGKNRKKPGAGEGGDYYHIIVRDKYQFEEFRYHDVGDEGGIQRLSGQRENGNWDTQKWIVEKHMAHREGDTLIPDHEDAKNLFENQLESTPKHVKGDIYEAKHRKNVPEKDKPTVEQQEAWAENIQKAQKVKELLDNNSKSELYEKAEKHDIEGRSQMDKNELANAVAEKLLD